MEFLEIRAQQGCSSGVAAAAVHDLPIIELYLTFSSGSRVIPMDEDGKLLQLREWV